MKMNTAKTMSDIFINFWINYPAFYEHLLYPQFLQVEQPPSNARALPHSGQTALDSKIISGMTSCGFDSGTIPDFISDCISLCISNRAFAIAIGQQEPKEVSFLVARRTA